MFGSEGGHRPAALTTLPWAVQTTARSGDPSEPGSRDTRAQTSPQRSPGLMKSKALEGRRIEIWLLKMNINHIIDLFFFFSFLFVFGGPGLCLLQASHTIKRMAIKMLAWTEKESSLWKGVESPLSELSPKMARRCL